MKQIVFRMIFIGMLTFLALNVGAKHHHDEAKALIEKTTDKVLTTLKKDSSQVYELVDKEVLPIFDFYRMSMLALGKNWKKLTSDQKHRFAEAFRGLLVRTYATALVKVAKGVKKVECEIAKEKKNKVTVSCKVYEYKKALPTKVDYAMHYNKKRKTWKVYNIVIGGMSLVNNYRTDFAEDIKNIGIEKLIEKVQKKEPKKVN